jgi:hypothetical protein
MLFLKKNSGEICPLDAVSNPVDIAEKIATIFWDSTAGFWFAVGWFGLAFILLRQIVVEGPARFQFKAAVTCPIWYFTFKTGIALFRWVISWQFWGALFWSLDL